jgi:hypothetical protein
MPSGLLRILRIFAAKNTVGQTKNSSVSTSSLGVLGALAVRKYSLQSSILNPQSSILNPQSSISTSSLGVLGALAVRKSSLQSSILNPQSSISSSTPMTHQPPQHTLALAPWSVWSSASLALWEIFQVSGEDRFPLRPAQYHSHIRKTHA